VRQKLKPPKDRAQKPAEQLPCKTEHKNLDTPQFTVSNRIEQNSKAESGSVQRALAKTEQQMRRESAYAQETA